jgi:hypothetical protein
MDGGRRLAPGASGTIGWAALVGAGFTFSAICGLVGRGLVAAGIIGALAGFGPSIGAGWGAGGAEGIDCLAGIERAGAGARSAVTLN